MSSMDDRRATNEEMFSDDDVRTLAKKAVARLIADAAAGRSNELADVIEACIRRSPINLIRDLKWLLGQQELERPPRP